MQYNLIVIEGNIGAGKTSLVKKIARQYNSKIILEQYADNPFLPKFYKNPDRYAFPLELSFLAERYNQLKNDLATLELFKTFTIADYFFMKSLIFAKQTLPIDEYNLYRKLFDLIYKSLPKPDLYVYLHVDVDRLLVNIAKRGRDYEQKITANYLKKIQDGYFDFFKKHNEMKVLVIDVNNVDFVNKAKDYNKTVDIILNKKYNTGINRVIL